VQLEHASYMYSSEGVEWIDRRCWRTCGYRECYFVTAAGD